MKTYISAITGCSYAHGDGLDKQTTDPNLWINLLYNNVDSLKSTNFVNCSMSGSTNLEIFLSSLNLMTTKNCKYLFVCWTELLRYKVNPSVESYNTQSFWSPNGKIFDIKVNPNIVYSADYITNIKNRFLDLQHPHWEIIKILEYSKILKTVADKLNVDIFFINGLLPWDNKYFEHVDCAQRLPSDTTTYTQEILNSKNRSDTEYFELYDRIHKDYEILNHTKDHWLNLYHGFQQKFFVDSGNDGIHPGPASHKLFFEHLQKKINNKIL